MPTHNKIVNPQFPALPDSMSVVGAVCSLDVTTLFAFAKIKIPAGVEIENTKKLLSDYDRAEASQSTEP